MVLYAILLNTLVSYLPRSAALEIVYDPSLNSEDVVKEPSSRSVSMGLCKTASLEFLASKVRNE